jgi:mannose-1-phosphate guanylyltransferase
MVTPVILSGGSGTRLWPLSRSEYPKQFIDLVNDLTLFQDTIVRLPDNAKKPLIICNEDHRFIVAEQLRNIDKETNGIILEPTGKNTAPAVALAALNFNKKSEDPILLVLSADHLIQDIDSFHGAIKIAEKIAKSGKLVTFGIDPTHPETGYGYIKAEINNHSDFYNIESFIEKPNLEAAEKYLKTEGYYWNSGMFVFQASTFINELKKFNPEIFFACQKSINNCTKDFDFIRLDNKEFLNCPSKSIDYAVMELTEKGVVVPLSAGWNDVGSWSMLHSVKKKDSHNNVIEGDIVIDNVSDSYIHGSNRLIGAIGLSGIIIIDTEDALLVLDKKNDQDIKNIVKKLKNDNRKEPINHRKVFRPWGYYDSIDSGKDFQVKRILVNPNSKISLQMHQFRSEHWIIISGSAIITCGKEVFKLNKNQSTYIPKGQTHRLENPNDFSLELIEVQTGSYLGEDDIIRFEDDYQRK